MATSGFNGRNETFIGYSYGLSLSFLDQNGNELAIKNTLRPIQVYIPRDPNLLNNDYKYVNVSYYTNTSNDSQILPNGLYIYATNASLHIQIKPTNSSVGYLVLIKFGSSPILTSSTQIYDNWTVLCPNSTDYYRVNDTTAGNTLDEFYLVFFNMQQVCLLKRMYFIKNIYNFVIY